MTYADYSYYTDEYLGNVVPETDFPRMAKRASEYLDYITDGNITETADKVSLACCAVAEALYQGEQDGGVIASESKGEWSVSYASTESIAFKAYKAAYMYLCGTGLLYKGVIR